jgi:hypothetical protein
MQLPEQITKIAEVMLNEIEKYYPGLINKRYDNFGFPDEKGTKAFHRAEMCIYIELMKAGAFKKDE